MQKDYLSFYALLCLILAPQPSRSLCKFPESLAHHAYTLWWSDAGLSHSTGRKFLFTEKVMKSIESLQFNRVAAEYGWNQMQAARDLTTLYILQICPEPREQTESSDGKFRTVLRAVEEITQNACGLSYESPHKQYSRMHRRQNASVLNIRVNCLENWGSDLFFVELNYQRYKPVYQCVRFNVLHDASPPSLIELYQGQYTALNDDPSLCLNDGVLARPTKWMRFPVNPELDTPKPCPIAGGFQIRRVTNLDSKTVVCESKVYASLEIGCLAGEGVEWSFSEPRCNPFAHSDVTHFSCHSWWSTGSLQYIVLYRKLNEFVFQVYQMVYRQLPGFLQPMTRSYAPFSTIWLLSGLYSADDIEEVLVSDLLTSPQSNQPPQRTQLILQQGFKAYQVEFRRAFGICEDEQETCAYGCSYSAQNQLFCHRACMGNNNNCETIRHDSCRFRDSYQGSWMLIDQTYQFSTLYGGDGGVQTSNYLALEDSTLVLNTSLDQKHAVKLHCVREIHEAAQDWYILQMNPQPNGCHARHMCLEISQGRKEFMHTTRGTNTLLYRLSLSRKRGISEKELCDFLPDLSVTSNPFQKFTPKVLVRDYENHQVPTNDTRYESKCRLYELRLKGILIPREATHWAKLSLFSSSFSKDIHKFWHTESRTQTSDSKTKVIGQNQNSHVMGYGPWMSNNEKECTVELTDFNEQLGSTGEFDSRLRIVAECNKPLSGYLSNAQHICLSTYTFESVADSAIHYSMLITYLYGKYYCWIFRKESINESKHYTIVLFESPQCDYRQSSFESLQIHLDQASAVMRVQPEPKGCPTCSVTRTSPKMQLKRNETKLFPAQHSVQIKALRFLSKDTENRGFRSSARRSRVSSIMVIDFSALLLFAALR